MGGCVGVCVGNSKRLSRGSIQNYSKSTLNCFFQKSTASIDCIDIMKNYTLLIALAWLARFLLVQANSPPPRRIRNTTVVKKGSTIPLPSSPFGDAGFRNSYSMNSRKYHKKGKHHERQLQNKKTRKRNDKALKGTSQRFDWKRGRGRALKGREMKKLKGEDKRGNAFRKFVAW